MPWSEHSELLCRLGAYTYCVRTQPTQELNMSDTRHTSSYLRGCPLLGISLILYMSPNYFSTFFKQNTGCTLRDYLKNIRIRYAVSILANSDDSVSKVGEMVVLHFPPHFMITHYWHTFFRFGLIIIINTTNVTAAPPRSQIVSAQNTISSGRNSGISKTAPI